MRERARRYESVQTKYALRGQEKKFSLIAQAGQRSLPPRIAGATPAQEERSSTGAAWRAQRAGARARKQLEPTTHPPRRRRRSRRRPIRLAVDRCDDAPPTTARRISAWTQLKLAHVRNRSSSMPNIVRFRRGARLTRNARKPRSRSSGRGCMLAPKVISHRIDQFTEPLTHRCFVIVGDLVNTTEGDLFGPILGAPNRAAEARLNLVEEDWHAQLSNRRSGSLAGARNSISSLSSSRSTMSPCF